MLEVVKPQIGLSLEEFSTHFDRYGAFELINGEVIPKMPTAFLHAWIANVLYQALMLYCLQTQIGRIFAETTFILPDQDQANWVKGSRIPDLMFIRQSRLETYRANKSDWQSTPLSLVPDLVIEIVSPTDCYSAVNAKTQSYLQDGVQQVWIIDPKMQQVIVHTPDDRALFLSMTDTLRDDTLLPDFSLSLADLFSDL